MKENDDFGLQDIDYQPLKKNPRNEYYDDPSQSISVWPKIFGVIMILVIAFSAAYYFLEYKPKQDAKNNTQVIYTQPKVEESTYKTSYDEIEPLTNMEGTTQTIGDRQHLTVLTIKGHEYVIYNNEKTHAVSITHSASCKNH